LHDVGESVDLRSLSGIKFLFPLLFCVSFCDDVHLINDDKPLQATQQLLEAASSNSRKRTRDALVVWHV